MQINNMTRRKPDFDIAYFLLSGENTGYIYNESFLMSGIFLWL